MRPAPLRPEPETGGTTDLLPRMLRTTAGMGASAAVVMSLTIVRTKFVAIEEGAGGVGSLSLLTSLLSVATMLGGFGVANAAIREIAAADARADLGTRDAFRRAAYLWALVAAVVVGLLLYGLARPLAELALGDAAFADEVRLSAVAAAATIVGTTITCDLNGLRRVRSMAIIQTAAAGLATAMVGAALVAGADLVAVALVAPGVALAVVSFAWWRSLPALPATPRDRSSGRRVAVLVRLGAAFMLNAVFAALGALGVRLAVDGQFDRAATGEFHASLAIAGYLLSFLFAAMAADYFPLLSGVRHARDDMNRIANAQMRFSLLIGVVPLMALQLLAAPAVHVLYTPEFDRSPELLRLVLVGEGLRIAAWTTGYLLAASGRGGRFVLSELAFNTVLVVAVAAAVGPYGLAGAATAYAAAQGAGLVVTLVLARRATGFAMSRANVALLLVVTGGVGCAYAASQAGAAGVAAGTAVTLAAGVLVVRALRRRRRAA